MCHVVPVFTYKYLTHIELLTMYVGETLYTPRIKTTFFTLVVVIFRVLFMEELMLCFLFDSDDRYYPIIVFPNS